MRLSLVLLVLLVHVAHADEPVRDDIVDLRHHRLPYRRVFLGWTSDGRAVVHATACGVTDAGGPFCTSSLEVIGRGKTESIPVLQPVCSDSCDPFGPSFIWSVPTEVASQAIRTERAALDKLGALQPSAPGPLPQIGVRGDSCKVDAMLGDRRLASVIALGRRCIVNGGADSVEGAQVIGVQRSPDQRSIAVTVRVHSKFMEWNHSDDTTRVFDAAP